MATKHPVPILMYHSVSQTTNPAFQAIAMPPQVFAEQMGYLQQNGYTSLTVTQFAEVIRAGGMGLPEKPVILTFDDGYADFYTDAFPILQRYGFTAIVYVVAAYVGYTSRWLRQEGETNRPLLNWEQLREISAAGMECGAHSCSHPQLDVIPLRAAYDEIVRSKEILENELSRHVLSFAYPFGYYTPEICQLVQSAGFSSACAVKFSMSALDDDLFALARLMPTGDMNGDQFTALVQGHGQRVALKRERLLTRVRRQLRRWSWRQQHSDVSLFNRRRA